MYHLKAPLASLIDTFYVAAGTVTGRRHIGSGNLLSAKNNQDAYSCTAIEDAIVLSVHDGCGSTAHSEFGARYAAAITPIVLCAVLGRSSNQFDSEWFEQLKAEYLMRLELLATACLPMPNLREEQSFLDFVRSHLLFTILAAVVTPKRTVIFGIGDGVYYLNGKIRKIGPFVENAPDYLSKALLHPKLAPAFSVFEIIDTDDIETLALGTDGVIDLLDIAGKKIPGKSRLVASLPEVFEESCLFSAANSNRFAEFESLTGWLRLVNSEVVKLARDENGDAILRREEGLLPDDTTLLALRRNRGA